MGKRNKSLKQSDIDFIKKQYLFFVGTATADSFINISSKGMDSFRVVDTKKFYG